MRQMWMFSAMLAALAICPACGDGDNDTIGSNSGGGSSTSSSGGGSTSGGGGSSGDGSSSGGETTSGALGVAVADFAAADGSTVRVTVRAGDALPQVAQQAPLASGAVTFAALAQITEAETLWVAGFVDVDGDGLCDAAADAVFGTAVTGTGEAVTVAVGPEDADGGQPVCDNGGLPVSRSLAADVQPIFSNNCALSGCHSGSSPTGGQNLEAGMAFANIVDVTAQGDSGETRVIPYNAQDSFLVKRIEGRVTPQMPLGMAPLPDGEITAIRTWIAEGAWNN